MWWWEHELLAPSWLQGWVRLTFPLIFPDMLGLHTKQKKCSSFSLNSYFRLQTLHILFWNICINLNPLIWNSESCRQSHPCPPGASCHSSERVTFSFIYLVGGSLVTQKCESHMTAVCTAFSDCGSFKNPLYDTSPILSSIKISHTPNQSK